MFYRVVGFFIFFVFIVHDVFAQQAPEKLSIFAAPDWINYQTPPVAKVPEDQIQNGIYHLLVDRQISVQKKQPVHIYRHIALQVVNQNGLQDSSNINVNYDPSYESIKWHHLKIIRDGKTIARELDAKVSLLKRERQLEEAIYDGRLTLNIIIPDLRVGDIVDYSYSTLGQNPIYAGHFFDVEYLEWGVPLARFHLQLDWHFASKPKVTAKHTAHQPSLSPLPDGSRYLLDLANLPPRKSNSQTPAWFDPYARLIFSDFNNWSEVIDWGLPLYESAIRTSPDIDKAVKQIQQASNSPSRQVSLALHYVQDNIRYLGVEMGKNSHQPSLAAETLARRYGDCKDKAVLLITMLRQMGFDAWPALVNTDLRRELIDFPPAINAFDHVIVLVQVNGKAFWVDPTRNSQKGDLELLYQPDYGYALVIVKHMQSLQKMAVQRNSTQRVEEFIDISGKRELPVSYEVNSQYTGRESEVLRSSFMGSNIREKTDDYLNFYKKYYEKAEIKELLSYQDDALTGTFKVAEKYLIKDFWEISEGQSDATFYGNAVSSLITKPDEVTRVDPYYLKETEVKEVIRVKLDDSNWDLPSHRFEEKNAYFEFNKVVLFDKQKAELTLEFFYKTLTDFVPAEDMATYLDARKKVMDELEYAVSVTEATGGESADWQTFAWIGLFIIYCLVFLATILLWVRDKTRFNHLEESRFYPVSLVKFILLSFFTLGTYQFYWFYRNWCYIKRADKSDILPFARSFFAGIWAYSFYKRLVMGDETKAIKGLPKGIWAAVLFAISYLAVSILSNKEVSILFTTIFILITVPLAWYVLKIPQVSDAALKNNSRWLWRHSLLAMVGLPWLLFVYAQGLGFIPGGEIMEGKALHSYNLRFLQRNKIVPSDESIVYFYSTELLNMQDAGNGFTEKRVFAYWRGDNGVLVVKSVPFTDIKDIAENKQGQHTLKIKDSSGDDFDIYLSETSWRNKKFVTRIYQQWQSVRK